MKSGIHPEYVDARIICACGSIIETRSTVPEIHVEICSSCHPFFTGKQKLVDTAGRVEKFRAKYGHAGEGRGEADQAVGDQAGEDAGAEAGSLEIEEAAAEA